MTICKLCGRVIVPETEETKRYGFCIECLDMLDKDNPFNGHPEDLENETVS